MNLVNYKLKSKSKNPQNEIAKINLIEDIEELNKNALFSKENLIFLSFLNKDLEIIYIFIDI